MKKLMIYFLATALACGLAVSLGHAQAPPYFGHTSPSMYPYPPPLHPPPIPDLRGCWQIVAIITGVLPPPNSNNNVAIKIEGENALYLEVTTQEGTRCYGTLHIPAKAREYPIDGFINGTNVSAFTNTTTYGEEHRYITSTLTKESGELVMYGMGISSVYIGMSPPPNPSPSVPLFLNQFSTFRGTRVVGVEVCPP